MDDDEDFEALFFSEAKELLETLQEQLNHMSEGTGDEETVHAAFRAVHSVKGGAAAFGFDRLIGFAHVFETVMDRIRDGQITADDDVMNLLLRSGDMMQVLVEDAQNGEDREHDALGRLGADLARLAEIEMPEADIAADDPAPEEGEAPDDEAAEAEETPLHPLLVRFTPEDAFFSSGHDMLKLVRSARERGLKSVDYVGTVPPLASFDPMVCPISFDLNFEVPADAPGLAEFLQIYEHIALIEYPEDIPSGEVPEDEPADADPRAADAPDSAQPAETGSGAEPDTPRPAPTSERNPLAEGGGLKSLRVDLSRIDRLVNLVGEMLISQAALSQQIQDSEDPAANGFGQEVEGLSRLLRELQESVMAIRAQPVKSVFRRMPRVVRDLADKLGKDAKLELSGENTEVDATVIEELTEPLTHMIRNAMDHGLESPEDRAAAGKPTVGRIWLSAEHHGEKVAIIVEDDGKGVDRERVYQKALERGLISAEESIAPEEIDNLIFHPGFSTAVEVSSVSGRGVGMDVVKKKIVALGGRCSFESKPGKGTRFTITLPLTLAVMDGMTVSVGDQQYILPLSSVVEALRVPAEGGKMLPDGTRLLERRGEYLRLFNLRAALQMPASGAETDMAIVIDTETSGPVAIIVDELIGQRQVVLKSLETNFKHVEGVSGATIMGDGNVALILDVANLIGARQAPRATSEVLH